jgi:glycerol kinase
MYILAIDQGTTGSTSMVVDSKSFKIVSKSNTEFKQVLPEPGIVEHNLDDIWESVKISTLSAIKKAKIKPSEIQCIGITNQRETISAFTKSGAPIENAIVWQDRRTIDYCEQLKKQNREDFIKEKTGLTLDPYFSGTKINWLIKNSNKVKEQLEKKDCLFGTIDSFLTYRLTANQSHVTEPSNASRTLLMDISNCEWSQELCDLFEVPMSSLPSIKESFSLFGKTKNVDFLPDGIPITGILGDQQSALFGQGGIEAGDLKCTYGTGAFALINTGKNIKYSKNGLLTTVAFKHQGKPCYAIEGSSYIAGAAVQWLRDNLNIFNSASEIEEFSKKISNFEGMENLCFYPYFTGIGSPHWKPEALASILGISRDTSKYHISLSCLESIALTIDDLIKAMEKDTQLEINKLRVDGGAVVNNLLNTLQASFSNLIVERPSVIETTAFGAILAAAVGMNLIDMNSVKNSSTIESTFSPVDSKYFLKKKNTWKKNQAKIYN